MTVPLYNKAVRGLARLISARGGWRTERKIVVIESDDWGSARLPNKKSQTKYFSVNPKATECAYLQYDCLESDADVERIGNVLTSLKDSNGRPLCFTPNYIMANPDFTKIRENSYNSFHYESFLTTMHRNNRSSDALAKIKSLSEEGIWWPQLHGREHINTPRWLAALRENIPEIVAAFDQEIYGVSVQCAPSLRESILQAYTIDLPSETEEKLRSVSSGCEMFKKIFGSSSRTFIPPNYIFASAIHRYLVNLGIEGLQGLSIKRSPVCEQKADRIRMLGRQDDAGLVTLIRNVFFEPSLYPNKDNVSSALSQINQAFLHKKPAVICSHRVNFMGGISIQNQDRGLRELADLITQARAAWPNIEFMSTSELLTELKQKE